MSFLDRLGERVEVIICPIAVLGLALLGCGWPGGHGEAASKPRMSEPLDPLSVHPCVPVADAVGMPLASAIGRSRKVEATKWKGLPVPGLRGEFAVFPEGVGLGYLSESSVGTSCVRIASKIDFTDVQNGFAGSPYRENFCVRWTGFVHVARAGRHVFYLSSDDGSRLYIDEQLVVNNDGPHGMEEREGTIELTLGHHAVRVEFFQGGGGAGCQLHWQPAGKEKQLLEGHCIWHYRDVEVVGGTPQF